MKRALLAVAALSLVSIACSVEPFSNVAAQDEVTAGQAGAGAPDAAGSAGTPSSGAGGSGGKLTTGHGGKPSGGAPSAAGTGSTPAGAAGTGGSGTAGTSSSSGGAGTGGSAGSSAGMPAAAGTGTVVTPSCSTADAFGRSTAPSGPLTIGAWSGAFAKDNVCWTQEAASCSFEVDSWGQSPTNAARYRLFLKNVKCDKSVYYGSGTADSCKTQGDCNAFDGSNAAIVAVDFDLTADASGSYVASNMEQMASNPSGSGGNCEIASSPAADMLTTATEDLLSGMTFSCGK